LYRDCGPTSAAQRVRYWLSAREVNLIPGQRCGRLSFGWGALSESEARVVRLATEGLTDRQIGQGLYLSRYSSS
jgi:DNA-binding NarL/FixJ family response regulator